MLKNNKDLIQRVSINQQGRDYVVGDIHGMYSLLDECLSRLNFNKSKDRLFSVGDLVDRGPESDRALEWLDQDWFYAILGNHDEMLLRSVEDKEAMLHWFFSGGRWWTKITIKEKLRFLEYFSRLPLVLEIETSNGLVGLIHADIPKGYSWQKMIEAVKAENIAMKEYLLWGRERAIGRNTDNIAGIDKVYCGHTIYHAKKNQVKVVGNVVFLDTGAFLQYKFSGKKKGCFTIEAITV